MARLRHVLWIGGATRTGKTTIARRIARRHGLRLYSADTRTWAHRDRAIGEGNPAAERWEAMTPDERWLKSTPAEMFEMSLHAERGTMIVDDLQQLPASPLIVAEGTPISPAVVSIAQRLRAVWLIPTPEFRRVRPEGRHGLHGWLATAIERESSEEGVAVLRVDASRSIGETVAAVEDLFAEAIAKGPRAESSADRRELLREANAAVVSQCLGYLARPWSAGHPASFVREFVCECDDPDCDAVVEAPIAAASLPLLAPGHR